MQLHVLSQVSRENFSPFRITTFSKQLVPERASCSLSTIQEGGVKQVDEKTNDINKKTIKNGSLRTSSGVLTLLHTPIELSQDVIQEEVVEGLKVLSEDVTDGIKCMIACCGHPLGFLEGRKTGSSNRDRNKSKQALADTVKGCTSVCCSGSFMLSKILKTIRKRSCHQCFSNVCP